MSAFHNDPSIKKFRLEQAQLHIDHDQLVAGSYGEGEGDDFKGCTIGCHYDGDHSLAESTDGLPVWYAKLADTLFEGVPEENRAWWHKEWAECVPVGMTDENLERVKWKFLIFIMDEVEKTTQGIDVDEALKNKVLGSIDTIRQVYLDAMDTGTIDSDAESAESAARSAESAARSAESAARSAASAARSAASAARSAESAARSAASAARSAASAARSAARSAAWSAGSAARSAGSAAWSAGSAAKSAASASYLKYAKKIASLFRGR